MVVRSVRWYFVLPQAGQQGKSLSEESAGDTCLGISSWVFSLVIFGTFFSSAE
jgi:hypothetical protein